jgi:hypothetical protein
VADVLRARDVLGLAAPRGARRPSRSTTAAPDDEAVLVSFSGGGLGFGH